MGAMLARLEPLATARINACHLRGEGKNLRLQSKAADTQLGIAPRRLAGNLGNIIWYIMLRPAGTGCCALSERSGRVIGMSSSFPRKIHATLSSHVKLKRDQCGYQR